MQHEGMRHVLDIAAVKDSNKETRQEVDKVRVRHNDVSKKLFRTTDWSPKSKIFKSHQFFLYYFSINISI
jgi:hypothetical protein